MTRRASPGPRRGDVTYLLDGAFRRMAVWEWGKPGAPAVICVHGMTRTGRDFDPLAEVLARHFHVLCPDLPGRGESDWLPETKYYEPHAYVMALSHLMARLGTMIDWIGTSLGGLCGMEAAAATASPVRRLVLNDVGPYVPASALRRIRDYAAQDWEFSDQDALEAHLREIHAPFGRLTDAQWAHLARHSARALPDGRVAMHYDPALARTMRSFIPTDLDYAAMWRRIHVPILVLRGESSDVLPKRTFLRMGESGARTITVPDTGHAPALMDAETIGVIEDFLRED